MKITKLLNRTLVVAAMLVCSSCKPEGGDDPQPDTRTNTTVRAVVIGMENSKFAGSCPGAHTDAIRMMETFRGWYPDVTLLENENATKESVLAALNRAAEADFMIVFYSGHGGSEVFQQPGPEEIDGKDEFLCLYDTYLRDNDIWSVISKCNGRVWLIFDCCHSETMFRSVGFEMKMVENSALIKADGMSMLCWSGCADDTYSYGDPSGGVFTSAILRNMFYDKTYDEVWKELEADKILKSYERIKRTKIGNGFDGKKLIR